MQQTVFADPYQQMSAFEFDDNLYEMYSFQTDIANIPEILDVVFADFPRLEEGTNHVDESLQREKLVAKLQPLINENDCVAT